MHKYIKAALAFILVFVTALGHTTSLNALVKFLDIATTNPMFKPHLFFGTSKVNIWVILIPMVTSFVTRLISGMISGNILSAILI